jgi:hypothetical protein
MPETKTPEQIGRAWSVLDHIEKNPDMHDQGRWIYPGRHFPVSLSVQDMRPECGTTACYAGWTVLLDGLTLDGSLVPALEYDHLSSVAADLLGLTQQEAMDLFHNATTLDEVRTAVTDIFGPRPSGTMGGPDA